MAEKLFRLGSWSFVNKGRVLLAWLIVLLLAVLSAVAFSGSTNDSFTMEGLESTEAYELIKERAPGATPEGATARIVFESEGDLPLTDPKVLKGVKKTLRVLATDEVVSVTEALAPGTVTEDGTTAFVTVLYSKESPELSAESRDKLAEALEVGMKNELIEVSAGGDALQGEQEPPLGEIVGIGVAFFVLLFTLGSLVAAGMPLLTAIVGVGIGMAGITALTGFIDLSSSTPALGTMLGLAVGIDYALFIMSRYQHEVRTGRSRETAIGLAVGTAGSAVVFAGLTVIIALAGLSLVGIGFLTQMGIAAAAVVLLSVLIALTLLPALLGFAKGKVVRGHVPGVSEDPEGEVGKVTLGRRWATFIQAHRWKVLVTAFVTSTIIAIPMGSLQLALPDDGTAPVGSERRTAYDAIAAGFGEGFNGPLTVVVDTKEVDQPGKYVRDVVRQLESSTNSKTVAAIIPPYADPTPEGKAAYQGQLSTLGFATVTIIPTSGPSSPETAALVEDLRESLSSLETPGGEVLITGQTAVGVDISSALSDAFPVYLGVVVSLALVLLILVFRSLWVPLKAALGFIVSLSVALGLTVAVFQWGWGKELVGLDTEGPIMFLLPVLLTGILFGLAMDYEVFLVTRMREAWAHGVEARQAVIEGFAHSARVVTAAALIMVGVFVGFAFTEDPIIKVIGFSLAVGIVADAFLVRMIMVPALMSIAGHRMWALPAWLDRLIPNLDIEGESLTKKIDSAETVG